MAQNFRSAFNGFNREDVVHYLEFINNKHTAQINQMTSDMDAMRQQLDAVPFEKASLEAQVEELQAQNAALAEKTAGVSTREAELTARAEAAEATALQLEQRCRELETALAEAKAAAAAKAAAQEREVPQPRPVISNYRADQELEAYRRAERVERVAKERADQVYQKTNSVLTEATTKVDTAASQIGNITEQVMAQLEMLQSAVISSKLALQDAAASMYHLRPNSGD